jgi:hypothetical protein
MVNSDVTQFECVNAMPKKSKSGRPSPILVPAGLKLNGPFWEIVREAFKRYGLNPNDLVDWRALLWCLACGPEKPTGGRPLKWNAWQLSKLRAIVDLMHHVDPKKSDTQCCSDLSKNKGKFRLTKGGSNNGYYEGVDPGTLRRRLQDARKPAHAQAYEHFWDTLRRSNQES